MRWQIGIDIGGTFTDVIAMQPATGLLRTAKVSSRTDDPLAALLNALDAVDVPWTEVQDLMHGTTMVTNAIVENNLSKVALVATEGFGDTVAIGRQNRRYLYRLDLPAKADPTVHESLRFEVRERMDHKGQVLVEMSEQSVTELVEAIRTAGADSIAVSLLHSYANGSHEKQLGEQLKTITANVSLSHQVSPEAREYERTNTTVLNAGVMPMVRDYLDRLEEAKPSDSQLHLFHSAGGMASPSALRDQPLGLAMSGPAAGVTAASRVAAELKLDHALSFDMGGTTTDTCLITNGHAEIRSDRSLAEHPIRQPMVAVDAIGAGGGSIAWMDTGTLRVGPKSAGAFPGPACYGRGGTEATVSDANLVLGYLDHSQPLGGFLQLDRDAAVQALLPLANAMVISVEAVAHGILRVATANMVRALRKVTVERGVDGRHCALIAYGGAGPMHAVEVSRAFGISKIVVPASSSMFSALGCVSASMSYSRQQTVRMASGQWNTEQLSTTRDSLISQLSAPIIEAGHDDKPLTIKEVAGVRYSGQSYAVEIQNPALDDPQALGLAFREVHEQLYGFSTDEPWELATLRTTVSLPRTEHLTNADQDRDAAPAKPHSSNLCYFDGQSVMTPRYSRDELVTNQTISGPAIVEDESSTIVIIPKSTLTVDPSGHLVIDIAEDK
ncbi:MAG: hydantoinase/oxoprolinase family protein [Amphritea sp.]